MHLSTGVAEEFKVSLNGYIFSQIWNPFHAQLGRHFTFVHLPARVVARDVPKIIRLVDQPVLITALTAAQANGEQAAAAEFLLANMSQRMAQTLREDMAARGKVKDKEGEAAMSAVITAVRQLEAAGELVLNSEEE